jgi:hypothetical protein
MTELVRCLDCKHRKVTVADWFISSSARYRGVCLKAWVPEKREFDPVLGEQVTKGHFDSPGMARARDGACSKEGRFWEPKNPKDMFKFIKHVST